jgi:AraC-like DNA-binding protein
LSCGMSDQSHFTRSFRRIVGETPSSWRQTRHDTIEERVTELEDVATHGSLTARAKTSAYG